MIKFAYKGNDKILIIKGQVIRALDGWIRKNSQKYDPPGYLRGQWYHGAGEYGDDAEDSQFLAGFNGAGLISSPPGSYLNNKSTCIVKDKLYTAHLNNQTISPVSPTSHLWPDHVRILEWDGLSENVQKEIQTSGINITPSGQGVRIVFGYTNRGGWEEEEGVIERAADPALLEYHGNLLVIGLGKNLDTNNLNTVGDEAIKLQWQNPVASNGFYYTMLFNPMENSGSGLMYLKPSGALVELPTWISNAATDNTRAFKDTPFLNYNMTDAILHEDRVYIANACDVLCWYGSGISYDVDNPSLEVFYRTDQNYYRPNPKWFAKFDGDLYMYEASGVLSKITPRSGSTSPTKQNMVNFSYIGDMHGGGIHAREHSFERATKATLFAYKNKLHVIMGGGSGTFYVHSDDASTWTNASSGLPAIMRSSQGNVYHYYDEAEDFMYIFYVQMSEAGVLGITTAGTDVANVGHLYRFNGTTWTTIGWYPLPTMGGAGGFIGYDPIGPQIHYPSGAEFYFQTGTTVAPEVWKCKDYAIVDYWLYDKESRKYNIDIEYSIDDGETWSDCDQKKDYGTQQLLGEGKTGLTSAPSGIPHEFYWDFVNALGYNFSAPYCRLRVIPSISMVQ
jgi:hypothetical protein